MFHIKWQHTQRFGVKFNSFCFFSLIRTSICWIVTLVAMLPWLLKFPLYIAVKITRRTLIIRKEKSQSCKIHWRKTPKRTNIDFPDTQTVNRLARTLRSVLEMDTFENESLGLFYHGYLQNSHRLWCCRHSKSIFTFGSCATRPRYNNKPNQEKKTQKSHNKNCIIQTALASARRRT